MYKGTQKINNVKDFGAVGDGIKDDTQAIQDAIDNLYEFPVLHADNTSKMNKEGGVVFFPAGSYKVTKTIYINKTGVSLRGTESLPTVIIPTGKLVDGELIFEGQESGKPIFEFSYFDGANNTGNRSFIRNIGMSHLTFNLNFVNKVTTIRILRPYDLCVFKNLIFFSLRGTAIQAISDLKDSVFTGKGLGQGLVLRDIHIDNSASAQATYTKFSIDKGRAEDATAPVIHFENMNESSLTNVKIIACGKKADSEGKIILTDGKASIAHAERNGLLLEGCQGITIKECAFAQVSKPAILIQRGVYGKQVDAKYHFIQSNTFEEVIDTGVKIDGGAGGVAEDGRAGVSQITISENRFLGINPPQYGYWIDNCNLVVIKDRAKVYVGYNATNSTIQAVDLNNSSTERQIIDYGIRTTIMGKEYEYEGENLMNYDAYTFHTRLKADRLTIPIIHKEDLYQSNRKIMEGDIALVKVEESLEKKVAVLRSTPNGTLKWTYIDGGDIFSGGIRNINEYWPGDGKITGSIEGDVDLFRVIASFSDKPDLIETGGRVLENNAYEINFTAPDFSKCTKIVIQGLDIGKNILNELEVPIVSRKPGQITEVSNHYLRNNFIYGALLGEIKKFRLLAESATGNITEISLGGTIDVGKGTFQFYLNQPVSFYEAHTSIFIEPLDEYGVLSGERVRVPVVSEGVLSVSLFKKGDTSLTGTFENIHALELFVASTGKITRGGTLVVDEKLPNKGTFSFYAISAIPYIDKGNEYFLRGYDSKNNKIAEVDLFLRKG